MRSATGAMPRGDNHRPRKHKDGASDEGSSRSVTFASASKGVMEEQPVAGPSGPGTGAAQIVEASGGGQDDRRRLVVEQRGKRPAAEKTSVAGPSGSAAGAVKARLVGETSSTKAAS